MPRQSCPVIAPEIARHLEGNWREERLFNLASALRLYDAFGQEIATCDEQLLHELRALQPPERPGQVRRNDTVSTSKVLPGRSRWPRAEPVQRELEVSASPNKRIEPGQV
jgi:hypothetical protein